ncbi:shaggy-related protein kinase epsilon [Hibiscus syriacus]|uniref:Shaggy-related protein kinase epsilon n=1 Tax=Hibiscus syriacus TaxID=106335 RepID=A0A6A2ZZI8_HIBSY|nr:shaggy-related protein kinase epsilon [Hibiscus syriacus]
MERCGSDTSIAKLTYFICAAQMAKAADALLPVEDRKPLCNDHNYKKRQNSGYDFLKKKKQRKLEKKLLNEDDHVVYLPNPMIGFGVSTEPDQITQRTLPEDAIGPLYFYYENVALAPNYVLDECRKWNLVWVGRNKVVPLELDEVEMLLDAQELNDDQLEQLMSRFGEFDLVVGRIPYNNLTGRNKHRRDELEDFCWCIFLQMTATVTASSAAPRYSLLYLTLPETWKSLVDSKTGYLYFWNLVTNVTPYERSISVESVPMSYSVP